MKYQLSIRLFQGKDQGELVLKTVTAKDPDDAFGQSVGIIRQLKKDRLNPNLEARVVKCRQVGDADLQPA